MHIMFLHYVATEQELMVQLNQLQQKVDYQTTLLLHITEVLKLQTGTASLPDEIQFPVDDTDGLRELEEKLKADKQLQKTLV